MCRHPASGRKVPSGLLALSLLLLSAIGCRSGSEDSQGLETVLRFIERDPQTLFRPGRLAGSQAAAGASELIAEGTKVTLDDEVRNVLAALPGLPVERRLEVPRGARLRLSYGAPASAPLPLDFRVLAHPEGGEALLLFEASLAAEPDLDRWHRAEIDLSPVAGRTVRIELATDAEKPVELRHGIPVWGNPEVLAPSRRQPPPNVVLISIDTLRSDRMSLYGNRRPTTPYLDRWAESSATVFDRAVAQAPWTVPSHLSLLSGLNAHRHADLLPYSRPSNRLVLAKQVESAQASRHLLAERLREHGFLTVAVTGGGLLHPRYGFGQGFDRYRYFSGSREEARYELEQGLKTALSWLEEHRERPFFLFFHTYEVHGPYLAREPFFSSFVDVPVPDLPIRNSISIRHIEAEGFQWTRPFAVEAPPGIEPEDYFKTVYDSSIAYADSQLHRLFEALAESGLDQRTMVVVTSDHGQLFGEHGLLGHHYLYDENLLVPLIIAGPGGRGAGRRVSRQVRLVDIVPTVLELAGLPVPEGLDGVSLAPLMDGREEETPEEAWSYATRPNRGLSVRIADGWKYVFNNTAWAPLHGKETAFRVGREGEVEVPASQVPEIAGLRRRVRKALDRQVPGLRMRLQSDASSSFSGSIRGSLVAQNTVKSSDMTCDCLNWVGDGEAAFEVPPGQAFTLNFELAGSGKFVLALAAHGGSGAAVYEQEIEAGALDGRHEVALTSSGWRSGRSPMPESGARVVFWWVGQRPEAAAPVAAPDPALGARLRALGYLD